MKRAVLICLLFASFKSISQSCHEWMYFVKTDSDGQTYTSNDSDAISKVTFYEVEIENQNYYFAIVCFKKELNQGCDEYIYQVNYDTQTKYSMHYTKNARKAFWKYIQPYNNKLGCAP